MPRRAALEALERFRRDGAWSRQVINQLGKKYALTDQDQALAARLFYGTLQNLTFLDFYLDSFSNSKLEPKVRDILRLGAYQLLFLVKIPASAAVNESVVLCRELGYARASGLVNAVLRRLSRQRDNLPPIPGIGTEKYLSVRYSHPLWLVDELVAIRGYKGAEAVLRANNQLPPIYIQVNTCRTTEEELASMLSVHRTDTGLVLDRNGDFTRTEAFQRGYFYVQDPAARAAVDVAALLPGMRVLDVCAAPGGKSFSAAIAMGNKGSVTARDILGKKLALVSRGAERMGLTSIRCEVGDARDIHGGDYDAVFVDVPCSGLGVVRKKPDIRWRAKEDLASLPELQLDLLCAAATAVRPGGLLIYSTCTWRTEENQGVTEAFLRNHGEFRTVFERTFWPNTDGTDGFYVCRMDREKKI